MWSRTLVGFLIGLLLSISLVLNINLLIPLAEDTMLLVGLLLAFPIWTGVLVWCYGMPSTKTAMKKTLLALVPMVGLNVLLLYVR